MNKQNNFLATEGDINFSDARQTWWKKIENPKINENLVKDNRCFLHQSLSTPCLNSIEECEGIYLIDSAGKKYMDFHGNNVHQIGFRNQYVIERVKSVLDKLPFSTRRYTNKYAIEAAEKLAETTQGKLSKVLFAPGGTSAVGIAIKLARLITGKPKIISMWDSFHGASMDSISVGGEALFRNNIGPLMPGVIHIPPYNSYRPLWNSESQYIKYIEYLFEHEPEIGCFMAETIRNTDVNLPSKSFWKKIRELCDKFGVLLCLDEIPICMGRTGKMYAYEHYDIIPDILILGKGLGGGIIPFAAILTKDEYDKFGSISLGHYTHEKSPTGSAACTATIQYINDNNLISQAVELGKYFGIKLVQLHSKYRIIGDVRGIGLLWAIELVENRKNKQKATEKAEQIMYYCLEHGLNFKVSQGSIISLSPPLIINKVQLDTAIDILDNAFKLFNGGSSNGH